MEKAGNKQVAMMKEKTIQAFDATRAVFSILHLVEECQLKNNLSTNEMLI